MTDRELLAAARRLLTDVGWTRGTLARDERGQEVSVFSAGARCFCALGAIHRAAFDADRGNDVATINRAIDRLNQASARLSGSRYCGIAMLNDDIAASVADVTRAFDLAETAAKI